MPEKTHGRSLRNRLRAGGLLELLRRSVTERRIETDAIVVDVDEGRDVFAQMIQIAILAGINLLPLEGLHEALATGVVVGVRLPAHAWNQLVFPHTITASSTPILNPPT